MSMKLNLKLLAIRFFQAKDGPPVPEDGVNRYLLEQVLRPNLEGDLLRLGETEDVPALEAYYERLYKTSQDLSQFAQTLNRVPPAPKAVRAFC